jgi:hypothetical protein
VDITKVFTKISINSLTSFQHSNIGSLSYPGIFENKLKLTGMCSLVKLNETVLLSSILLNILSKSYVI